MGIEQWLAQFTQVLQPLNLFVMSFVEAIFLPIPPDVMLIPMVIMQPESALYFALLTTVASVGGAVVGFTLGLKGGRPLLQRFAKGPTIRQIESIYHRYDFWAIVVAGFLPLPYKLFALSSGVFGLDLRRFIAASVVGRGARFIIEALFVRRFGEQLANAIVRWSGWFTAIVFAAGAVALIVWWWRRRSKVQIETKTDM